jgi:hypothetical protein
VMLVALSQAGEAKAAPLPPAGVFTYSNQCFEHESGDLSGLRVTLLHGPGGHIWAVTYVNDEAPFLASTEYDLKSGSISFEGTNGGEPEAHFVGSVDTNALFVSKDGRPAVRLRAISNTDSKIPYCPEI